MNAMSRAELVPLLFAVAPDLPEPALARADAEAWAARFAESPLELGSLAVLQLVDLLEARLELILTSADVTRAHFATLAALSELVARRLAGRA